MKSLLLLLLLLLLMLLLLLLLLLLLMLMMMGDKALQFYIYKLPINRLTRPLVVVV